MHEAIDYSALRWVRQELREILRQARLKIEAYANSKGNAGLLHDCAARLHEVRGPLQMIDLKGADRLAAELEEVLTDLLQGSIRDEDAALELTMQALLQLPEYLTGIHSGRHENPAGLLPVINGLRASRGMQPLQERAFFSPNLSVRVPLTIYNPRSAPPAANQQEMARSARLHFQGGLLEWYRGGPAKTGLQTLVGVLETLQQDARSEPAARVWWVGAGLADAVLAGELPESPEIKQLFGQLDRQIKRLLDYGESVFADTLTDELLTGILFEISRTGACSDRVDAIKATYGLQGAGPLEASGRIPEECLPVIDSELMQAVSGTVAEDIGNIKEQLDEYARAAEPDANRLAVVADAMHTLGNTLDIVGLDHLCQDVSERVQQLRGFADPAGDAGAFEPGELAATLVAVEDAVRALAAEPRGRTGPFDAGSLNVRNGLEAVAREALAGIAQAKLALDEFSRAPAEPAVLAGVPDILNQASGSLEFSGQERAAAVTGDIGCFINRLPPEAEADDERLELLAEALCGVECFIEGWLEDGNHGEAALAAAEQCVDKLSSLDKDDAADTDVTGVAEIAAAEPRTALPDSSEPVITGLQVIAADVDEELLSIFGEEAGEALAMLQEHIPVLRDGSGDMAALASVQRAFHTLKGSGRMLGAMAVGEFAWLFEKLLNRLIEGTVAYDSRIGDLLDAAPAALEQLLAQATGAVPAAVSDIDALARQAARLGEPDPEGEEKATGPVGVPDAAGPPSRGQPPAAAGEMDLPVLSADADEEIVEIFLEEAIEQVACIAEALPVWLAAPEDGEALGAVRRSFHTLKGSGRMAGAMRIGEFSWAIEDLLNRLIDGSVRYSEPVANLLEHCTDALSQLIVQVQDGTAPVADIPGIMATAAALSRGEVPAQAAEPVDDGYEIGADAAGGEDAGHEEPSLLELFRNESRGHIAAIHSFLDAGDEPSRIPEAVYRALHTLSGISESADIPSVQGLTSDLNEYFSELYDAQQPASCEAMDVLRDAAGEMERQLEQLPGVTAEEQVMVLRNRIAALPRLEVPAEHDALVTGDDDRASQDLAVDSGNGGQSQQDATAPDQYSAVDEELYEIFIEESSELVDASESVLRCWSEDPGNSELRSEFQRQLHTIKGGARMVDIQAIGDLSHAMESLLVLVAEGTVATSGKLFAVLHAAQDRLAEMLDRVKAHQHPEAADDLQQELEMLAAGEIQENPAEEPATVTTPREASTDTGVHDRPDAEMAASDDAFAMDAADPDAGCIVPAAAEEPCREHTEADSHTSVTSPVSGRIPAVFAPTPGVAAQLTERRKPGRARSEQVRVQSGLLDDMVNHAGEISIYRTRMEQQISDYRYNLAELDQTISRLRDQLRQLEMETEIQVLFRYEQEGGADRKDFDPLEMDRYSTLQQLSRSLMESISDLRSLQELMEATTRESETLLLQQSRVSTDLQEGLMHTRMIPFAGLASRLRRVVRQTARQLNKKAELVLQGGDGEIDRTVIDRIVAPLEHMLRNAVAHGIEAPQVRNKSGKAETGRITVTFEREGPEIVLRIEDDGAGMDIDAIRARALKHGLMQEDSGLEDDEIIQFILQTGFSTASDVTQISGRGVGMDVVNTEVKQLGGSLHIESKAGAGSVFTLRLPYTLAINQVLLVMAGLQNFCIPLASIEGVVRARPRDLTACYATDDCIYEYGGNRYQLKHLGSLLGTGGQNLEQQQERVPVLLARIGEKRVALQVESLLGSREIVIKPLGILLGNVEGISGATILGDGSVVLILDMAAVARMHARTEVTVMQPAMEDDSRLVVMVVDDSITVRKVTTRLLERNGFKVLTAKDGVDAVGQLQHSIPDMMLLDIEMPRMDGFELATHMRNDEQLRHVPIIMITSRTGDKHRQRAHDIGVDNYLGKPYQENDLLESIHRIIGASSPAG